MKNKIKKPRYALQLLLVFILLNIEKINEALTWGDLPYIIMVVFVVVMFAKVTYENICIEGE